jgi:hypothetical protein
MTNEEQTPEITAPESVEQLRETRETMANSLTNYLDYMVQSSAAKAKVAKLNAVFWDSCHALSVADRNKFIAHIALLDAQIEQAEKTEKK